jgi:hypothetical protein
MSRILSSNRQQQIVRLILGVVILGSGINFFIPVVSMPVYLGYAGQLMAGVSAAGYIFPLFNFIKCVCGILFLLNRKVPLALLMVIPILLNRVLFHLFLAPQGLAVPVLLMGIVIYLIRCYQSVFIGLISEPGNS